MRANQSYTAIGMHSCFGVVTPHTTGIEPRISRLAEIDPGDAESESGKFRSAGHSEELAGDGLLHDARNLISAIGLYCDLLSMPGVLKAEHMKYPEELRLLGMRSQEMIERLMLSNAVRQSKTVDDGFAKRLSSGVGSGELDRTVNQAGTLQFSHRPGPVTLRSIVDRCSGLLSRVANGRAIEVAYGPAADVPIRIAEESVERILVNLVRNGSAALGEVRAAIRISAGLLNPAVGDARAWPFQRVRLVVEDSGCGMESRQLEALLSGLGPRSRGNHGIGFRVVRELVTASDGELRAASARGIGTRIQIEWPMADMASPGRGNTAMKRGRSPGFDAPAAIARTNGKFGSTVPASLDKSQGAN